MKKLSIFLGIGLLVLASGCGRNEDNDKNIIAIKKDDTISETIYDTFDQSYYTEEELKESIEAEIEAYNSELESEPVELKKCEVDDQAVTVKMMYDSAKDYMDFNHVNLFHGTIEEFVESEYHAYVDLKDLEGNVIPFSSLVASGEEYYVVALDMDCVVEVKGSICYMSSGVEPVTKKSADVTHGQDVSFAYIVYK